MDAGQTAVMITGIVVALLVTAVGAMGFWTWLQKKARGWGAALDEKTGVPIFGVVFEKGVAAFSLAFERLAPEFKKATADGKIDPEEWRRLRDLGLAILKDMISGDELRALNEATNGNVSDYLEGMAPHAVAESKRRGSGAKKEGGPVDPSR